MIATLTSMIAEAVSTIMDILLKRLNTYRVPHGPSTQHFQLCVINDAHLTSMCCVVVYIT